MSVLICSTRYSGCGYVGHGHEWKSEEYHEDFIMCPICNDDHAFQLSDDNFNSLTNPSNKDKARVLLDEENKSLSGAHLKLCFEERVHF